MADTAEDAERALGMSHTLCSSSTIWAGPLATTPQVEGVGGRGTDANARKSREEKCDEGTGVQPHVHLNGVRV